MLFDSPGPAGHLPRIRPRNRYFRGLACSQSPQWRYTRLQDKSKNFFLSYFKTMRSPTRRPLLESPGNYRTQKAVSFSLPSLTPGLPQASGCWKYMKLLKCILNFNQRRTNNLKKTDWTTLSTTQCQIEGACVEINSGTVLINPSNRESIQVHFEKHLENYSNGQNWRIRLALLSKVYWITVRAGWLFKIERQTIKYKLCLP